MTRFAACLALCLATPLATVEAQADPVVIELFTSQGCASCPPADGFVAELAARDDVLPLALHVDYWDYIGWADTFAQPAFTARQREYAHTAGHSVVYTPQMIIGGRDTVAGHKPQAVLAAIEAAMARNVPVSVTVTRDGASLRIRLEAREQLDKPARVIVVEYAPSQRVDILRGENAGKSVEYVNVVRDWRDIAMWDGRTVAQLDTPVDPDLRAAVLVQADPLGAILGAARAP